MRRRLGKYFRPSLELLEGRLQPSTVRFAVIGDYGSANSAEADVANLVKSWNPDLILTVGDNNYPVGSADTIDENVGQFYHEFISPYVGSYGAGSAGNRFFPILGNHDWGTANAQPYLDYFTLPGNERYYTFTSGPVQFFGLDSDYQEPDGRSSSSRQALWLQDALLSSTALWRVVYLHHPPYSSGEHGSDTRMQWPFQTWGASVVLAGHDHDYERVLIDGLPYFVTGSSGSGVSPIGPPIAGSEVRYDGDYGAMKVEASDTQMTFEFINRDGVLIDSYALSAAVLAEAPTALGPGGAISSDVPAFTWTAVAGAARYDVWVDDSAGQQVLRNEHVGGTSWPLPTSQALTPGSTYSWRVGAVSNDGLTTLWSGPQPFTIGALAAPAPDGPSGTSYSDMPYFSWADVPRAAHYDLVVDNLTTGQTELIRDPNVTWTYFRPSASQALTPGQSYRWQVGAVSTNGLATAWSAPQTFTIQPLPAPAVRSPTGIIITAAPRLSWTAVTRADRYDVRIDDLTTGVSDVVRNTNVTDTSWKLDATQALTRNRAYSLRVGAVSTNGLATTWSAPQTFILAWKKPTALYVSTTGSDNNSGTASYTPFRTFSRAMTFLQPGLTLFVKGGTYYEQLVTQVAGAAGQEILITSYDGTAIIDGSTQSWTEGSNQNQGMVELRQPHYRLANIKVTNSKNTGVVIAADNVTVQDCEVFETQRHAISTDTSFPNTAGTKPMLRNITLEGNDVHHAVRKGQGYGQAVSITADGFLIKGNSVHHNLTEGIDIWLGAKHGEVVDNEVYSNERVGIYVDGASYVRIHGNRVHDGVKGGMGISSESNFHSTHHIWLYNNVIYDNGSYAIMIWDKPAPPGFAGSQDVLIAYNTLANNYRNFYLQGDSNTAEMVNNVGYTTRNDINGATNSVFNFHHNVWLTSPSGFVSAETNDFRLVSTSPAVDQGTAVPALADDLGNNFLISVDFLGLGRVFNGLPDAGAFEYQE